MEKDKKYSGFSFIEVIVALFIMSFSVITLIALFSNGMKTMFGNQDHKKAVLLAQEGIELVRNVRDNNWATHSASKSFDNFPQVCSSACKIDKNYVYPSAIDCSSLDFNLYLDANNFYTHNNSGQATRFKRKISLCYYPPISGNGNQIGSTAMHAIVYVIWGSNWPADVTSCNILNKCAYAEVNLNRWGE